MLTTGFERGLGQEKFPGIKVRQKKKWKERNKGVRTMRYCALCLHCAYKVIAKMQEGTHARLLSTSSFAGKSLYIYTSLNLGLYTFISFGL